jgi:hypothetical protein
MVILDGASDSFPKYIQFQFSLKASSTNNKSDRFGSNIRDDVSPTLSQRCCDWLLPFETLLTWPSNWRRDNQRGPAVD